jgi:hypothetical protein
MRKDSIHSIKYIFPVIKDDYGNDFWLALINAVYKTGETMFPSSGYLVISKNAIAGDGFKTYAQETEAFWKSKERELIKIEKYGFYIEEYNERFHSLEWQPKSAIGYQGVPIDKQNLVTRFYVRYDGK